MICEHCHKENRSIAKFCKWCGKPLVIQNLLDRLVGQGSSLVVVSTRADNELVSNLARVAPDFDAVGLIAVGESAVRSGDVNVTRIPVGADAFALLTEEGRSG